MSQKSSHAPSDVVHLEKREPEDHQSPIPPLDASRVNAAWCVKDCGVHVTCFHCKIATIALAHTLKSLTSDFSFSSILPTNP